MVSGANRAARPSSETLAEFRELAAEAHKLAELLSAADIQGLVAQRPECLSRAISHRAA
jgi:hypothetical protein